MKKPKASGSVHNADDAADRKRHEQPLQAVLLADDWLSHHYSVGSSSNSAKVARYSFHPLVLDRPKILCPLLNGTMVDYVISYLISQGVKELYVVCTTKAVEDYLLGVTQANETDTRPVVPHHVPMKINVIRDATVTNAGDALRELDKRNVIHSDPFLLLHGDCVTNVNLSGAIAQHKERHAADSSAIHTLLFKAVGGSKSTTTLTGTTTTSATTTASTASDDVVVTGTSSSYAPIRPTWVDLLVGIDSNNRILLYDDSSSAQRSVTVPCSFYANHLSELIIRNDLLDVGLDLCSPDVLARFSDEFDYRDIRSEFVVNSVAEEEEGLQNKLYAHFVPADSYAARVADVRTYHAISRDMLRRYVYPMVPDHHHHHHHQNNSISDSTCYAMQRHYMYYETTGRSRVGRSAVVSGPGMVGANCFIGERCRIRSSVLSSHCHLADGCTVQDSHLWDGVQVEEGATILQSILAHGAVVKAGAVIERGCIVGAGCVIGVNVRLPAYTRLTSSTTVENQDLDDDWSESESDDDDDDNHPHSETNVDFSSNHEIVGSDGKGRIWISPIEDDDGGDDDGDDGNDDENMIPLDLLLKSQCIGFEPQEVVAARWKLQTEDDDSLSMGDAKDIVIPLDGDDDYTNDAVMFGENPASSNAATIVGRQEGVDVVKELKIICLEFEAGTSPIENLAIELNSYKFSQNASYADCTMAAMLAILERMSIVKGMSDGKLVTEFKSHLDKWAPLLQKMSVGLDEEKAIVLALEQSAIQDTAVSGGETLDEMAAAQIRSQVLSSGMSFRLLLQTLHDQEIVSEEAILAWAADRTDDGDTDTRRGRLFRLQPLQDFLEWLDEESDDDEDDDDEDEEE